MNRVLTTPPAVGEGLIRIDFASARELVPALRRIMADFPGRFAEGEQGVRLAFRRVASPPGEEGFVLETDGHACAIGYTSIPSALRGLAAVMGGLLADRPGGMIREFSPFGSRGVMIDTSRNGVPRIATLEYLIRRCALMGLNTLYLYCEDTIPVPGVDFHGYFRGGYTPGELRTLDAYAEIFGMEIVPCIQVLGHMEQVLQWPAFWPLRDTPRVLLADEPATYSYLEKLIVSASEPFRTRRIHIGMDEAHGVGSGAYRQRNGPGRPFDILVSHLDRVASLCARHGLQPMIWSDMFFRLTSRTNGYYDPGSEITAAMARHIPDGVRLVYWDYYHCEEHFYDEWIRRHRLLEQSPVFATGVWTWNRFWAELPHTFATMAPGLASARRNGISEVFATLWGDDGMECDLYSALPGLEFFAGECFGTARGDYAVRFAGSCDADWTSWCAASHLDHFAESHDGEAGNPSKLLLWHDPLLGFLEAHLPGDLEKRYATLESEALAAAELPGANGRLRHPALLAGALRLKAGLHCALRQAYQTGDFATLRDIGRRVIPELLAALARLHESHRRLWHELYQPFGWDVIDRRYGGLRARVETLAEKLSRHLEAGVPIPELALTPLPVAGPAQWTDVIISHARAASPSAIS